ncbi:MAG: hypothetical protein LBG83_04950 [Oscillospiraceae bacterium]|jgi:hypothetical protein|nr:hypothetical protein [Oscillospiraceae bacterium]
MEKESYAMCNICKHTMAPECGCSLARYKAEGKFYDRIRVGSREDIIPETMLCRDCNAGIGQYHHLGCAQERCPMCREQFFLCDCIPDAYILNRDGE